MMKLFGALGVIGVVVLQLAVWAAAIYFIVTVAKCAWSG